MISKSARRAQNREYMRRRRAEDPAGVRKYQKRWRHANLDHARAYDRRWRRKNRKRINARKRVRYAETQKVRRDYANAWYAKNVERIRKQHRAKYRKNRKKILARKRRWKLRNHARVLARARDYDRRTGRSLKRSRRERGIPVDAPRPHDGICPICLRKKRLVADHDHTTGRFRGMICIKCNTTIGWIELPVVKQNLPRYLRGEMADAPCGERTDLAGSGAA